MSRGTVLDIGCAHQAPRRALPAGCLYIGLDYPETAAGWYGSSPQVYGDAQCLPFSDGSIETVLLLDVLEHLPDPGRCMAEIARVLDPNGAALIQIPFLYPLHDQPLDFHRWTIHGLRRLVAAYGLEVTACVALGSPLETAGLLLNIAWAKRCLDWMEARSWAALLCVSLPIVVPLINLGALTAAWIGPADDFMPHGYRIELRKK